MAHLKLFAVILSLVRERIVTQLIPKGASCAAAPHLTPHHPVAKEWGQLEGTTGKANSLVGVGMGMSSPSVSPNGDKERRSAHVTPSCCDTSGVI